MACYHPILAWRKKGGPDPEGKWALTFDALGGEQNQQVYLPCGRCIGCRERIAREWTVRCVHESQMHDASCFITLTYSQEAYDKYVKDGSLNKREFQLFMKRLRKDVENATGKKIRFFAAGEYGGNGERPHYHAGIFGYDFPDKYLWTTRGGNKLYRSERLEKIWNRGYCTIGNMDYASAAYLAGYVVKKLQGPRRVNLSNSKQQEFALMSRRPGIGATWLEKYADDIYSHDECIINGLTMPVPKYYDNKYKDIEMIKSKRAKINFTSKQLRDKEINHYARNKINKIERSYESGVSVI